MAPCCFASAKIGKYYYLTNDLAVFLWFDGFLCSFCADFAWFYVGERLFDALMLRSQRDEMV